MTLDKAQATALRKPFPKESVGILPKPLKKDSPKGQCPECHGYHGLPAVHLDYVGHAAVTDRLLTVDSEWTWAPMMHDPNGFPSIAHSTDPEGNLWITLTVCGITRPGVGDGSSAKERVGDAIRNAAMRFGVALDLWAKESLVEFQHSLAAPAVQVPGESETPGEATAGENGSQPAPPAPHKPAHEAYARATDPGSGQPLLPADAPVQASTGNRMIELMDLLKIPEPERIPGVVHIIGRQVGVLMELTESEARQVVDKLDQRTKPQGRPVTRPQMRMLMAAVNKLAGGQIEDAQRFALAAQIIGRPVDSYSNLTTDEASKIIDTVGAAESITDFDL